MQRIDLENQGQQIVVPFGQDTPRSPKKPLLSMKGVTKFFGAVKALAGVDLELMPGEVLILVGENGAGKSTLMKILAGAYQKDSGDIKVNGQDVDIHNRRSAMDLGISIVYQEQAMIPMQRY